jgi:vacuolar-type H+-ATPase subunit I/STV1
MNSGTFAVLGSILAFVIIFILGKKSGKGETSEEVQETLTKVAQTASEVKSEASAEVAQAKAEVSQAKSEQSKAEAETVQSGIKAELAKKLVFSVLNLVDKNEQSDETMSELQAELESAKRYNNIGQALDVARKQAARAVELGMSEGKE